MQNADPQTTDYPCKVFDTRGVVVAEGPSRGSVCSSSDLHTVSAYRAPGFAVLTGLPCLLLAVTFWMFLRLRMKGK